METNDRLILRELYHIIEHLDNASRARTLEEFQGDVLMAKGMAIKAFERESKSVRKDDTEH